MITTALLTGLVFITIYMVVEYNVSDHLNEDLQREADRHSQEIEVKDGMIVCRTSSVTLTKEILSTVYVKENHLPLVLVSSSKLGSINHTLLSIDYCMNNNIELKTVVYSQFPDDDQQIANSSFEVLKEFLARNYSEIKLIHSKNLQKNYDFELSDLIS